LIALAILALALAVVLRRPWFQGNFGVVARDRVFRSAQPERELEDRVRQRRIASILNLRGGSLADPFYVDEVRLTQRLGVDFYDFPMSATRRPTRNELLVLIDVMRRCRYPLLIHCKSGSDRTALASAVYLIDQQGADPDRALKEFGLAYGHVAMFGTERLHEPFIEYGRWLTSEKLRHSPERFREWVQHEYKDDAPRPDGAGAGAGSRPFRPIQPGPRPILAEKAVPADGGPMAR
jgi:protein tyrosine phosphatase (PTP) superfamily phosphohydrolase (DUF442 family)